MGSLNEIERSFRLDRESSIEDTLSFVPGNSKSIRTKARSLLNGEASTLFERSWTELLWPSHLVDIHFRLLVVPGPEMFVEAFALVCLSIF
jgi:hypothetical protein